MPDETDETGGSDAKEGGQTGPMGGRRANVRPPSQQVLGQMWVAYRDGTRSVRALSRAFRLHWSTVRRAVEEGWPEQNIASFLSRLELWTRQRDRAAEGALAAQDRQAAEEAGQAAVETWATLRPKAVKLAVQTYEAAQSLPAKFAEAAKAISFVRYRKVREVVDGKVVVVDRPYVDGASYMQAYRMFAAATKDLGQLTSFLMGGPLERTEVVGLPELTEEQMEQLRQGHLPPGVTETQVAKAFLKMAGVAVGGGSDE